VKADEYSAELQASLERLRRLNDRTTTSPSAPECTGTITVAQERRDYVERGNSYNSLFYIVHDSCGNEISMTRTNPISALRLP
jgi:hypothetical protein